MSVAPRFLTKSRFQLAVECPTKLYYSGKPEYSNRRKDDSFLAQLAEGGYQVGELACLMHPGGVRVDVHGHEAQLLLTQELLRRENVTIFEAAIGHASHFIRVDILRKHGQRIELIEVKAKSYDPVEDGDLCTKKGEIKTGFLPYVRDVAYQTYVTQLAFPMFEVHSFLMMADKSAMSGTDGINQRFRVRQVDGRLSVEIEAGLTADSLGPPLLAKLNVDSQVAKVFASDLQLGSVRLGFAQAADYLAKAYVEDRRLPPMPTQVCAKCEFRNDYWPDASGGRSGFHDCWQEAYGWQQADFKDESVLDIWNLGKKSDLIARGVVKAKQVTLDDLGFDGGPPDAEGMTRKHRQYYQCSGRWPGGRQDYYFDADGMRTAMRAWTYPLHFIDFETSAVALPFVRGRRPYEMTAFQFSHHVLHEDGRVEHRTQFIEARPGVDPNVPFLRALRDALSLDGGSVMCWATHESTVLNKLREQLLATPEAATDAQELIAFVDSLTIRKDHEPPHIGGRAMVDLCRLAERHYFHPSTKGSSSLKKVLPALMGSSVALREKYSKPSYVGAGSSLNLAEPVAWWQTNGSEVLDPYSLLPPIFDDLDASAVPAVEDGSETGIREGGAAMAAYSRLQFEDLPDQRRTATEKALLRYCELDTLAMVMAVEAWMAEI